MVSVSFQCHKNFQCDFQCHNFIVKSSSECRLEVPRTRTKTYGDRTFAFAAADMWNKLLKDIRQAASVRMFKSKLKTHLFRMYFLWLIVCYFLMNLKTVVEEVLKCHFDKNELLMVLKSLWVRKYFDKILVNLDPFPVGVTQRSSRSKNFKMLEMTFHVYQFTRKLIRTTKIYSLVCVGCMVKDILTEGHPKVKWGQIFNNIRFAWMTYQIIPLG